jgi:hypothetical protein
MSHCLVATPIIASTALPGPVWTCQSQRAPAQVTAPAAVPGRHTSCRPCCQAAATAGSRHLTRHDPSWPVADGRHPFASHPSPEERNAS